MKRVLLDYLRRRGWLLALGLLAELVAIGFGVYASGRSTRPEFFKVQFGLQMQLAIFLGVLPLASDLRNGVARTVMTLPLRAEEIGRAWWLAAVGLPGGAITALTLLGAAIYQAFHPGLSLRWDIIGATLLSLWLWLGALFTMSFYVRNTPYADWRQKTIGGLWGLLIGGAMLITRWVHDSAALQVLLAGTGAWLTWFGWRHAGRLCFARAANTSSVASSPAPRIEPKARQFEGRGALAYLFQTTATRAYVVGATVILIHPVILFAMSGDWRKATMQGSGFMPYWLSLFISLLPIIGQLRFLRTLPLSTTRLAWTLTALVALPSTALLLTNFALGRLFQYPTPLARIMTQDLTTLAALCLSVPLLVWTGFNRVVLGFLVMAMTLAQMLPRELAAMPIWAAPLLTVIAVAATVILLKRALERGSRTYRPAPHMHGWLAAGQR